MSLACVPPGTEVEADGDGDASEGDGDPGDGDPGDGDGDDEAVCVGVTPLMDEPGDGDGEPPCADCAPGWRLYDFQPRSCGYEQTYGLDSFQGHVTLVAMLAGWCAYCRAQSVEMERMQLELALEGYDVQFVTVNAISADNEDDQQKLIDLCSFPLFQDTPEVEAWDAHAAGKDDMFIYAADGTLAQALPVDGMLSTNLSTQAGYDNVKQALIAAFE